MKDQWKTIERYAYLGIAMGLLILVTISSISYQSLIQIREDFDWVLHRREALLNLSYFLSDLKDAEMGQRGYLLTGQESYLKPYQYIEKEVSQHFAQVRSITANNITQQKKLDTLESLVTEQLSKLQELVSLQKNKGIKAAKQAITTEAGLQIMDDIKALIMEIDEDERALLDQRATKIAARVRYDAVVKGLGIILILITALLVISGVRRWLIERKKVEKEQMDVVNIKSDFVSMASHELKTPFKAIRESIVIVLDGSAGQINDEQKKFLTVAKRNVDRLAKFIDSILDFQKLNFGKMEFNMCENDINETVLEVCELLSLAAQNNGLNLITELDNRLSKITFDRDSIIQVLTNIISNAIKFTEKGDITITTAEENNTLIVSVKDTGIGIPSEEIPKLFSKFGQVSSAKYAKAGGTGLGLAISKEIITQHNGKIWAKSRLGHGITVSFSLPIAERRSSRQEKEIISKKGSVSYG